MPSGLPLELCSAVLEEIDDPRELMKLQKVCKDWYAEINRLLPHANWKKLCLDKIPEYSLLPIINLILPTLQIKNYNDVSDQIIWQSVYRHYKKWLNMINSIPKHTPEIIDTMKRINLPLSEEETIICFDAWSNWIAYGTSQGIIKIFTDYNNRFPKKIFDVNDKPIKNLKFWYTEAKILFLVGLFPSRIIRFWDMTDENAVRHQISYQGDIISGGSANNLLGAYNNIIVKFTTADRNSVITQWESRLHSILEDKIVAINPNESWISIVTFKSQLVKLWTITEHSILTNHNFSVSIFLSPSLQQIDIDIYTFVTPNKSIICLKGFLTLNMLAPWPDVPRFSQSTVNCIIVHGKHIITGLSTGHICIHPLYDSNNQEINLYDYDEIPTKILKLSTFAIIGIKVIESDDNIDIVVFTTREIIIIKV